MGESAPGGEKGNAGLITEGREVVDSGQTHHLPPRMLPVWRERERFFLCGAFI